MMFLYRFLSVSLFANLTAVVVGTASGLTGFALYDADMDVEIQQQVVDGDVIDLSQSGKALTLTTTNSALAAEADAADDEQDTTIASVVFDMDGQSWYSVENHEPYSLNGNIEQDYRAVPELMEPGPHTVVATPYSGPGGTGVPGTPTSVTFYVIESLDDAPLPYFPSSAPTLAPSAIFTLELKGFALVDTNTEMDIKFLEPDGDNAIDLSTTGRDLAIRARRGAGYIGSIVFDLDTVFGYSTANWKPFAVGRQEEGNYKKYPLVENLITLGPHSIVATSYTEKDGLGQIVSTAALNFTVIDSSSSASPTTAHPNPAPIRRPNPGPVRRPNPSRPRLTRRPISSPTLRPSVSPITATPSTPPSVTPSTSPSASPSSSPSATPSTSPSAFPSSSPRSSSSASPSVSPSAGPISTPTLRPSQRPSRSPNASPTPRPTRRPNPRPTRRPNHVPTRRPTPLPTLKSNPRPTRRPSRSPNVSPPTPKPTRRPSVSPTPRPTRRPTARPTRRLTPSPTRKPTRRPNHVPTRRPSAPPTAKPTRRPTPVPRPAPVPVPVPVPAPVPVPRQVPVPVPVFVPAPIPVPVRAPAPYPGPVPAPIPVPAPVPVPAPGSPIVIPTNKPTAAPRTSTIWTPPTSKPVTLPPPLPTSTATPPIGRDVAAYKASPNGSWTGEMRTWHKLTLGFHGPGTSEKSFPNPFTDYRLDVTFRHQSSSPAQTFVVPGYYAADGNAANSHATWGKVWLVHFAPPLDGNWTWTASFTKGTNVAQYSGDNGSVDSSPAGFFHGKTGSITVLKTNKSGRDHRGKGMLEYVGEHHLRFAETGEWFLKAGVDSPENLLAYEEFDNTPNNEKLWRKSWSSHIPDFRDGDPTWSGGQGKGIIGAVNYIAGKGLNVFSFLTMNINGDDKNVFPYLSSDKKDRLRIDVSKTAQWEALMEHADTLGLFMHFKLQEYENDQLLDGGALGDERRLYFREIIARFGHHLALNWNMGEENTNTHEQRMAFGEFFRKTDPYQHPVVVHSVPDGKNEVYGPLLQEDRTTGYYAGASLQIDNPTSVFDETLFWIKQSEANSQKWIVSNDEQGPWKDGVLPDEDDPDHDDIRKNVLWGNIMAGGAGVSIVLLSLFEHFLQ
jgi:Domain of unknown function (DUF5060)